MSEQGRKRNGRNGPQLCKEDVKPRTDEDRALLAGIRAQEAQDEARDAARYRWLRSRGAAFYGDPKRHLENGLVLRFTNLDEVVDYLAGLDGR